MLIWTRGQSRPRQASASDSTAVTLTARQSPASRFGLIDLRVGGTVDHSPRRQAGQGRQNGRAVGQIERIDVGADGLAAQQAAEFRAQLPGRTGYKDAHGSGISTNAAKAG